MGTTASILGMVFPGQGSQALGMSSALAEAFPEVRETYAEATEALGLDLWQLVTEGPAEALDRTENTQPAMLTADVAVWRVWQAQGGPAPAWLAGHSLGEYGALVAAGSLAFADAVRLVAERGRLMQAAVPEGAGAMAAILGLDDPVVAEVCAGIDAADQVVEPVNFNAPGQVVIAGDRAAVEAAVTAAKAAGARRALLLPVSVPSHCRLMQPAAERFAAALEATAFTSPRIPVLHNADVATHAEPEAIRAALQQQLYRPVRWVDTIRRMATEGVTRLVEAGPGKVLAGLNRRIDRDMTCIPVFDPDSLAKALEAVR